MSTENESIEEELAALTKEHNAFVRRELGILYLDQAEEVEYRFSTLPIIVCVSCGKEYRITHFCELSNGRVWKSSWKQELKTLFRG